MPRIHIDVYYDVTCGECGRSWSTDFEMGMALNRAALSKAARAAGWKCSGGRTLCPDCAKKTRKGETPK